MKAEYKRDLKNNYLVIEAETENDMEDYIIHMTEQNRIPGLLPMQVRKMDGSCYLYYEITSLQPMSDIYEKKTLICQDILYILSEIQEVLESVRRYLLNPQQIFFDPQYMYVNPESLRISFCYFPSSGSERSVSVLAEYMLKKLDHQDSKAVTLGYIFYQRASGENFSLSETLHEILEKDWKENSKKNVKETESGYEPGHLSGRESGYESSDRGAEGFQYEESRNQEERQEEYQVFHKDRKKAREFRLFQIVHPAILILFLVTTAATETLLYFAWINLTEAGGVIFLSLAASILCNRFWLRQKEKKKNEYGQRIIAGEDREFLREDMDQLRMELYHSESKNPYGDRYSKYESEDQTQCLSNLVPEESQMILSSEEPERYPLICIQGKILIVGKTRGQADILLPDPAVNRLHERLEKRQESFYVRDMNSRNGTYVNGTRLKPQEEAEIRDGDTVMFANVRYHVTKKEEDSDRTQLLY